ncbi:MAG: hypothetical protein AB2665_09980, partial [Candidatus Thiodiazotropha sp.]
CADSPLRGAFAALGVLRRCAPGRTKGSNQILPIRQINRGAGLLGLGAGWGEGLIRLRLTPAGRLRCARRLAALRAWSNEGFESNPPYPPNK